MATGTGDRRSWLLGAAIVGLWVVGWVGLQTLFFGGDPLASAIQGAAGGAAFAVVFLYLGRRDAE